VYKAKITLKQALNGVTISIPHLNGEELEVVVNRVVHPRYIHRVVGKGMPVSGGKGYGDLLISFAISFPDYLENDQREAIHRALGDGKTVWRDFDY